MPGLKCSVEFSEHYSDVEREFCHDEMTQECATEYSEECSTEIKVAWKRLLSSRDDVHGIYHIIYSLDTIHGR